MTVMQVSLEKGHGVKDSREYKLDPGRNYLKVSSLGPKRVERRSMFSSMVEV